MVQKRFVQEERLLGQRVQFWSRGRAFFWVCITADVKCGDSTEFPSIGSARLAFMASAFAYAVIEECSSIVLMPDGTTVARDAVLGDLPPSLPPADGPAGG